MKNFFYRIPQNIFTLYKGRNLLWQLLFIALTFILVTSGFDQFWYLSTQGPKVQSFLFPAVIIGFLLPVFGTLAILIVGVVKKNQKIKNTAYALAQAGLLGLGISSLYKVFTGRVGLPHLVTNIDMSKIFNFGFLRNGAFQGWPSSHTSIAFAMSVALIILYPENKIIRYGALIYAFYIGIGVSVNIHWFSDFVAGAILGTIIGIAVGKSFLDRYKIISNKNI